MNATQITALLACCSAADNRKPNPEMVQFWTAALGDLDFVPCRDAVVAHYQESTEWIMPAHIRTRVRRERAKAIANDEALELPPHDPDDTALHIRLLAEARANAVENRHYQPTDLVAGNIGALGGPVRRVNELPSEQIAPHLSLARQAVKAALIERQTKPEPEPLLHPSEYTREPQPTADDQAEAECQPNREASR